MKDFFSLTPTGRARRLRRVAELSLEAYDVGAATITLLSNETNAVFRIDAGDGARYVLRVGRGGNIAHTSIQVRSETEWLLALAGDTDLRVPVPIVNREGATVTRVEMSGVPGRRNCVLFRWLPGRVLGDRLSRPTMERYGVLAAKLHEHGRSFRPSADFSILRYDRVFPFSEPVVLLDPARTEFVTEHQRRIFAEAVHRVEEAIEGLLGRGAHRVIHADLHRWNVLVDGDTISPFDFEDLMWGWPVQDLAIALYYLQREGGFTELQGAFRAGYESIRPWPDATGAEIDTFMAGRALVLANDVELLEEPEYRARGPVWMAGFARRIEELLGP